MNRLCKEWGKFPQSLLLPQPICITSLKKAGFGAEMILKGFKSWKQKGKSHRQERGSPGGKRWDYKFFGALCRRWQDPPSSLDEALPALHW